jgi:hypothetical protein
MFYAASRERSGERNATFASLISGMFAIIGLALINIVTDFNSLVSEVSHAVYWITVVIGAVYWLLLASLVYLVRKTKPPNNAPEPTPVSVTPVAGVPVAPDTGAAHLSSATQRSPTVK